MKKQLNQYVAVASLILFSLFPGCHKQDQPLASSQALPCKILAGHHTSFSGDAGCIVRVDGKMLLLRNASEGTWTPPGGKAKPGETAACTAYRKTLESTGIEVEVGRLLQDVEGSYFYFECQPVNGMVAKLHEQVSDNNAADMLSVKQQGDVEVVLADPKPIAADSWRRPHRDSIIKKAFDSTQDAEAR